MAAEEKTVSALIESQLPDFVNADHPQFKRFLELYYQWLEQNSPNGISNTAGNTIYHAMKIENYRDIDQTPPEFVKYFKQEILPYFPENTSLSTEKIIKSAREFYSKKGSDESLRWLFKALFDEDIEINYPKEQIFIASDGKWKLPRAFRITVTEQNKNVDPNLLERRKVVGVDSGATCVIESANRNIDPTNGKEILEIYISNIKKYFNNGETIEIVYIDQNGTEQIFRERIIGTLSNIRVDSNIRTDPQQRRRGLLYNVGDPVVITGGLNNTSEANDAAAIVGDVSRGSIESVTMTFFGYGYRLYSNTEVIVLRSLGDDPDANLSTDLRVLNINSTACTSESQKNFLEPITYDRSVIDYIKDVQIGESNIAAFTLNTRSVVFNVTEDDQDDFFVNDAIVWANGDNYENALFKGKIGTPNGNTQIVGTVNVTTGTTVVGNDTAFAVELKPGQIIEVSGERRTVDTITNNFHMTTTSGFSGTLNNQLAYRIGPFGAGISACTGSILIYDIANTGTLSTILAGAQLNVLNTNTYTQGSFYNTDKTFNFNSITTYLVPANANSMLAQCFDFVTENTGGIQLISVLNGGGGFRSQPQLKIDSYYDSQLSINYDYNAEYEDKANTRQAFKDLGLIAHVWINNGGTNYAVNDIITFDGRGYGGNAIVQSVDAQGTITSVKLLDRGEGHLLRPTVYTTRAAPTYTNLTGTASIDLGNNVVVGSGTEFTLEANTSILIRVNNEIRRVTSIVNNTILTVNSAFNTSGTGNVISKQDGTEATLTAYLFSDGEEHKIATSAIGRVRDIRLLYRGYDYIGVPEVSLKVADAMINPILTENPFTESEYIYQGDSIVNSTFRANVKYYDSTTGLLRLYNYSGRIDTTVDLKTGNGIFCNINTTVPVPAPAQYFSEVIATGLPNPMYYGNGRARAKALFANGLIEFDGFYLNSDGFPSSDKVFQDDKIYHNFSYIVQSEKNLVDFETPVKNITHPAGMALISKTVLKSEQPQGFRSQPNVHIIMPGNGTEAVAITNSYSNVVTGFQTLFKPDVGDIQYSNTKVNVGDLFIVDSDSRIPISRIVTAVNSNTELEVQGNFIYTGQGKIRSNTVYDDIPGTVTVNPPISGTATINPPITGTVNVAAASNVVVGNNSTTFTSNLAANSIITVNNQTRLVVEITNNKHLIVNSAFTYSGTDNLAYARANVVYGSGTSFLSQLSVSDIITINSEPREITVINSDTALEVNAVYTNYGTGNTVYKNNNQISGVGTQFQSNLAVNDTIKVNNQVRTVVSITSDTLLTVNSQFNYYGTGNTIDKLQNTVLTVFGYSDPVESIVLVNDNVSFNIFPSNLIVAQTGTVEVFTANSKVVGSGTSFNNHKPYDYVTVNGQTKQIINIASATVMNVNSAFSSAGSGKLMYKRATIVNAHIESMSSNNLTLNVAINANVSNLVYLVEPNFREILTVPGTVNTSGSLVTANTSNANTPDFIGKAFIGNQIIIGSETKTVTGVTGTTITVDSNWTSPGNDKYLKVYESHSFNVVTLTI
jgi:hypothetical protein